jgi:hypothetical protein
MKKVFLSLLAVIVVLGLFAAAGYAGYRLGYAQALQTTANGGTPRLAPGVRPFDDFGMPMHRFRPERGFGRGGFPMMGFGFFSPLLFLARIAILVLVVWFIYWLFTRSGWRLTREPAPTRPVSESTSAKPENE